MKRFIYLICYLSVVFSCTKTDTTQITIFAGNISTANTTNCLITQDSIYPLSFDSTNTSITAIPYSVNCTYATIQLNNIPIPIYIEQGKGFDLALQKEEQTIKTVFTGYLQTTDSATAQTLIPSSS